MDLDTEDEYLPLNVFSISHIRKDKLSQDVQHRSRKSQVAQIPHKKVKIIRTSALLVIEQLKNDFRRPGDFTSRMQTRRNWRPQLLMKYFYDNQRDCKEKCAVIMQHDKSRLSRNFIPEAPKIYSISLRCNAKSLGDSNDLSSLCDVMRNFKKRFNIICRPTICKYWIAQSTPTLNLTDIFLQTYANQTMIINCTELIDTLTHNQAQKNNYSSYHNQSYQYVEKKNGDYISSLRDNRTANNRSYISDNIISGNFTDFSTKRDHKCDKSCVTKKDAQIQTLSRKNLRWKKTKERSKPTDKKISRRKCCDDKRYGEFIANFHACSQNSNKKKYYEKSRETLSIRTLESKRAEYINKFTAVNRQIEEITATLRETCYSDKNSRSKLEKQEKYFPLTFDNTRTNMKQESNNNENKSRTARKQNISKEKHKLINIEKILKKSESNRHKNVPDIFYSDNINNKSLVLDKKYPKDTLAFSINSDRNLNGTFVCDSIEAFPIKKTVHPSNRNRANKKKVKRHSSRPISLDSNLTKDDDEFQEFLIKDEFFDKAHLKNNFITSSNMYAKNLIKDFADLEELKCKKIIEKTMNEMAILEDIKRRIDRDFDDSLTKKNENDEEDVVTVSQKSSNLDHEFYEIASIKNTTMEESKFTPLTASTNYNAIETQTQDANSICNSVLTGATSEHSNKNSTLSKYFSCTQLSSLISLTENEDKFAPWNEDQITYDSSLNTQSNSNYYDLDYDSKIDHSGSNLNVNNHSCSNLDSSFDVAQYETCTQFSSPNKFLIETIREPNDTFGVFKGGEGFAENKICREHLHGKNERKPRVELEKRPTADSTLETSKSSRCVGSIDSGVFSSSLIDPYSPESFFNAETRSELKKKRAGKLDVSSPAFDFSTDSSCTDGTLDRRIDDIVRDLTKNLILCERRARIKLKEMRKAGFKARNARYPSHTFSRAYKFSRSFRDYDLFNSPRPSSEDEDILNISTPSLLSLSNSEIGDRKSVIACPL